jgi:hypothetical protein
MRAGQNVHALAFDELLHPIFEIGMVTAERGLRDFETSDEMVVLDHDNSRVPTLGRASC